MLDEMRGGAESYRGAWLGRRGRPPHITSVTRLSARDTEVEFNHELRKPFVPILYRISHAEFQSQRVAREGVETKRKAEESALAERLARESAEEECLLQDHFKLRSEA